MTVLAAAAEGGNVATELAREFGWNKILFIAQVINFILVIFVLKTFAFKPILAILEQRSKRIEEGEEKLKRIETQLAESEKATAETIEKANADAKRLIEEAKASAVTLSEEKAQEAISSAQAILAKAEEAAKAERATMVTELKKDFGRLVAATTTQVTGKVLSEADQKTINEDALAAVEG